MGRWLSPVGHAEVETDARVDGVFRVVMIDGDVRIEHTGKYLVFEPPRRLAFTWRSPYTGPEPSLVTVTLMPDGEETQLVLVHEGLPTDQVGPHAGGWGSLIERLAALLNLGTHEEEPARRSMCGPRSRSIALERR
jgi:uncharacterized protein YndB with AHSA1/START domain